MFQNDIKNAITHPTGKITRKNGVRGGVDTPHAHHFFGISLPKPEQLLKNKFKHLGKIGISLALLSLVIFLNGSTRALALSTTTVTTTAIVDNPSDGECDLWEALQAIAEYNNGSNTDGDGDLSHYHECNTGSGPHFVVFTGAAAGGTITLPTMMHNTVFSGLPFITDDVTLTGPVVIDGGGAAVNTHIFYTNAGAKLTLANMVVQNGYTSGGGGAIVGYGTEDVITIVSSSIQNNVAEGNGGAINVVGQVNVLMSNFSGNKALGLDANGTDYPGQGGAIYVSGYNSLNVSLSNFAGNIATDGGGAIYTTADTGDISDSVFNGNIVMDDAPTDATRGGGAIYNGGNGYNSGLTISRVAFNGNLSFNAHGGAIFNAPDGNLRVYDSSFNGNIAGDLATAEMGGAIYNQEVLDIRRVMFLGNVSSKGNGGAVANDRTGEATFANVTFTANGAPDGDGAGLWNGNTQQGGPASYAYLYNVTFSLNASPNNGAAIFNQSDGSHSVYVANTILDGIGILGDNCNEGLNSQGHNIDSANTCGFSQSSDHHDTDAKLKSLDFNGGPLVSLLSHGLNSDSPAVDAGDNAVCANDYVQNLDQRSDPRPKGDACDIGAFESDGQIAGYGSIPLPPGPIVIGNTSVGTPITNTFTILDIGNVELEVSNPLITGADPDQFEVETPFPVTTSYKTDIVVRCKATAQGEFTAFLAFTTNAPKIPAVTYQLECNVNAAATPGYGSEPIAPGTLDFGSVQVGNGSTQSLVFSETGNSTLTIGGAELTGPNPTDFTFNAFDSSINDGEDPVSLPITCTPSGYGVRAATLTLTTNDPTQPSVTYSLVCEGIAAPAPRLVFPAGLNAPEGADTLDGPYDVAISPDGLHAYVTSYVNDTLTVYRRDTGTGALTEVMVTSNADMFGPAMVEVSPDGKQVYVTSIDNDTFLIFNRNATSGIVTVKDVYHNGDGGGTVTGLDYPFGITVSPDGRFIYVASFYSNAIVTFYRDADDFVGYDGALVDNAYLYYAYEPVISPDGKHLYVSGGATSGTPDDGYVTVYERDILDGSLTFVQHHYEGEQLGCFIICFYLHGLSGAWGITVSPDGKSVYVASYYDNAVTRFVRNPFDGKLTFGGYITNSLTAIALETPDGSNSGTPDGPASIDGSEEPFSPEFPESPENLDGIEALDGMQDFNAVEGEGLTGAVNVKVSPDNRFVYVTGLISDSVAVFERNLTNGILTQVQVLYNGGEFALDGAREIGLSPDGSSVYVTAYLSDAVQVFQIANPLATLTNMLPASAQAGSGGRLVTIHGQNFVPGAVARVNGVDRVTTVNHPGEVVVTIPASDLASAGTLTIDVVNPAPGGGVSVNSLSFTVTSAGQNPVPSISELTPGGANGGDPALTLTIYGTNFISESKVRWNGTNRTTTYLNSTALQIAVTANDLLIPGPVVLTVFNPTPGGGTSNAVMFDIAAPGQNTVPTITMMDPLYTIARGAAGKPLTVHVFGKNFVPGIQGQWNGQNRPTQFVSETEVIITLNVFDVAYGGQGALQVINPTPGGGTSNSATLVIYPYAIYVPIIVK